MSELNNILTSMGIPSIDHEDNSFTSSTVQSMSNDAFDEVLNELGFNQEEPEYDEQAGEGHIEAVETRLEVVSSADDTAHSVPVRADEVTQGVILEGLPAEEAAHVEPARMYQETEEENTDIANQDFEVSVDGAPPTPVCTIIWGSRLVVEAINEAIQTDVETPSAAVTSEDPSGYTPTRLDIPEAHQTIEVQEPNHIEPNSPTLLLDATTSRFSGAEWYNEIQKKSVILAGLGGIGSHCCLQLARMNIAKLVLYDDDVVEPANMSGQLYGVEDVGKAKVDAMLNAITNYTSMQNVFALNEKFTRKSEAGDVMICGFDNMKARKIFFTSWYNHVQSKPEEERKNCLLIDGRLDISMLQVLCLRGDDAYNIERYQDEFLFSDHDVEATVCSLKQTTYLASMIGSIMVNLFTNWVANSLNPVIPYDLPFFTAYDAQNVLFNTEN